MKEFDAQGVFKICNAPGKCRSRNILRLSRSPESAVFYQRFGMYELLCFNHASFSPSAFHCLGKYQGVQIRFYLYIIFALDFSTLHINCIFICGNKRKMR
jgi:hypothetical protein